MYSKGHDLGQRNFRVYYELRQSLPGVLYTAQVEEPKVSELHPDECGALVV